VCTRAVSALAHYLEEEGLATVAISLIRPQTENTKPPRALWVPFELGRPFGPPGDAAFQRRVILAALGMLERDKGPVIIEDFPDDDPRWQLDPGWRPPPIPAPPATGLAEALAAQLEAERKHLAGVIAVVDDGGWPILVLRMDHAAFVASVELAPGKARTAALFKKPSQALEDAINHGRTAAVTAHDFVEMQGGLPVVVDGQVIGGIGASFDTPEHDVEIARAGLAALNR